MCVCVRGFVGSSRVLGFGGFRALFLCRFVVCSKFFDDSGGLWGFNVFLFCLMILEASVSLICFFEFVGFGWALGVS